MKIWIFCSTKQLKHKIWLEVHLKNWCFWAVVLEKSLESPLDWKEIQPVHPKGDQSWIFIGRTDAVAETPILWPPDAKNRLIGKDPDAEKNWRWEEKGMTEDEMVGWHHQLDGHEFEHALGLGDGQGSLASAVCGVAKTSTWLSYWTELKGDHYLCSSFLGQSIGLISLGTQCREEPCGSLANGGICLTGTSFLILFPLSSWLLGSSGTNPPGPPPLCTGWTHIHSFAPPTFLVISFPLHFPSVPISSPWLFLFISFYLCSLYFCKASRILSGITWALIKQSLRLCCSL